MSVNLDWGHVALSGVAIFLLVVLLVAAIAAVAYFALKKPGSLAAVEADVKAAAATPAGQSVLADVDQVAAAVAKKLQTAPPVTIPNHPALTAVADVLQRAAQAEASLAKVAAAVGVAHDTAAAVTKPA
jgi:flagellar basal body-associated protein FliL